MARTRIIFFGTGEFALQILEALHAEPTFDVCVVVTQPPRPVGRHAEIQRSMVHKFALTHNLPIETPEKLKNENFIATLASYRPNIFVVAQYGRIIPQSILAIPTHGALNVHGSLLPRWRGSAPVHAAIAKGDSVTGITFMIMDELMDHGPILAHNECDIFPHETTPQLMARLGAIGAKHIGATIDGYLAGTLMPIPQNHEQATYTAMLSRETGFISATEQTAEEIERLVRALATWPGVTITVRGVAIKILQCHVDILAAVPAGQLLLQNKSVLLGTRAGTVVVDELLPRGKKNMSGEAFCNGYRHLSGIFIDEPIARSSVFQTTARAH